ncbi:MAG: insulinase family protein [Treponema sp.]|jgi:Zn-dependent M16 (insulinase) family peptidase|nr:insulinase family protein [Treponema sp.]
MTTGKILESGFEILEVVDLPEFGTNNQKVYGIWARHQKSGAEVFHVKNDDEENLFAFAFATPPTDSTGVAHILEHSVLCGSETYPLKDAFLVLAQGSLQTFLNAWTFPDKTIYPASSANEQDYFNLMSVYGDAVFRPLLSEWTFMQEGHRQFFEPDGKLNISGVVYNEMKGAYSSLDAYAGLWSVKSVLPGTPYDFESGGDPECIPNLTWEGLKDFHRSWYSPANCRVFLAGNIPTEKQLAFLDEKLFSSLPAGNRNSPIPRAMRWDSPRSHKIHCPAGAGQKPTVLLSWLCGDATDIDETLALAALAEILLGHDGSPLTRSLMDSGLGEDLSPVSGLEVELRETSFCTGLRGLICETAEKSVEESAKRVESLIMQELERLEREGIPKEEIEATLLGMEFSHREIHRAGGPFSLVWMRRSFRAWLHGCKPWESLLFVRPFTELKQRIEADDRYFEKMIRRYLLDNPHRAFIIINPQEGFLEEKEAELNRRLGEMEASLGAVEKEAILARTAELERVQGTEDSPEALAAIPHLSRTDLKDEIEIIKREYSDADGVPIIVHPLFTNGISYVDLAFPLDVFPPEDYFWFPFFARAAVSMGLPGMDYGEVSSLMARTAGGFHALLQSGSPVPGAASSEALPTGIHDIRGRDWIIFRLKVLDEKINPSLDLALRLITEADFNDFKRLRDLTQEMKNELDSSLAPTGHVYASGFAGRMFSRSRCVGELWNGLDQILFAHKLVNLDVSEISAKLKAIQTKLNGAGLLVNLARGAPAEVEREIGKFGSFGPPRPRNSASQNREKFIDLSDIKSASDMGKAEIFASPSLQVGFAAISLNAVAYGSPLQAAELVLSHQLSTGALWEEIRMKGGAYAAFARPDHLEGPFSFGTYRDPNPLRSLEAFSSIIREDVMICKDSLDKAVIGTYARETHPLTPMEKSWTDFLRFLYGIEDRHRSRRRKDIIAVTDEQIGAVLKRLANEIDAENRATPEVVHKPVIIAGKTEAEKAAAQLGVEVRYLPV